MVADPSSELHPGLDGTIDAVEVMLASGVSIRSDEISELAQRAAAWNERSELRESGRPSGYAGASLRCARLLEHLIRRGLPDPGRLLHGVGRRVASNAVLEVLLAHGSPSRDDIDAALRQQCLEYGFDPNAELFRKLVAAGPSRAALDDALLSAARATYRAKNVHVDFEAFDAFEILLQAGARADHGSGTTLTALHLFVDFAVPNTKGDRRIVKRSARADEVLAQAIKSVTSVDALDAEGNTPLHAACMGVVPQRAKMLVDAGADPQRRNNAGRTPVDHAMRRPELHTALGVPIPVPRAVPAPAVPAAPPRDPFSRGSKVMHTKFGEGEVTATSGTGAARKLTVRFASGETKTLAASFLSAK
jgi:hypothetical protein